MEHYGLFSAGAAAQIVEARGIVGTRVTQVNAEATR